LDIDADKITCIIEKLQNYLHQLLHSYPWRTLDSLDIILDIDVGKNNALELGIDVDAKGSKPVTPSYDEALAQLIDKLRERFEEIINEGHC